MDSSKQDELPVSSPASSSASSTLLSLPPSSYLTVPSTRPTGHHLSLPGPFLPLDEEDTPLGRPTPPQALPQILEPIQTAASFPRHSPTSPPSLLARPPEPTFMSSVYSSASVDSEYSTYSNPPARAYRLPSFQNMSTRKISVPEKSQMIEALNSHQITTLVELRRIEKAFATLGSPDVTEPMTAAWSYYVNSHGLLTELRGLTKNYPFSSECLEEAKRRVYTDPQSNRSWNFCWLVLSKIQNDQLLPYYGRYQAAQPAMWGGRTPSDDDVSKLTNAFVAEWNWAVSQMLRHWDQAPIAR
ncbi:hypothetical protein BDV96DRAFT_39122 [Lophiotrema nucula]|uniref:Uncharacterized protein n=1 Tax=Lophiotrema nucula TaxID=690887 RepID=A0A6A5ZD26_9PLEO|nr:hypothetical protein BDV96DRAFT_39122 [Lophiotrema nucula]